MHERVSSVSVEEASVKVRGDKVAFIDVRSVGEYATGHAQGATNIPLNTIINQADRLAGYDAVYIICQSGGRSAMAVQHLLMDGVHAINVLGGTNAWRAAGLMME